MAEKKKSKTRQITITSSGGAFNLILKKLKRGKEKFDFSGISALRQLLSNEKARILHTIKTENPDSLYALAKMLGRDFASVRQDIRLLERFGFIDMVAEKTGKRERLRPIISIDSIHIIVDV